VLTGSLALNILSYPKYEDMLPGSILTSLESRAPAFWKWINRMAEEKSINGLFDAERLVGRMRSYQVKGGKH